MEFVARRTEVHESTRNWMVVEHMTREPEAGKLRRPAAGIAVGRPAGTADKTGTVDMMADMIAGKKSADTTESCTCCSPNSHTDYTESSSRPETVAKTRLKLCNCKVHSTVKSRIKKTL